VVPDDADVVVDAKFGEPPVPDSGDYGGGGGGAGSVSGVANNKDRAGVASRSERALQSSVVMDRKGWACG
jgi:hypothetical protein